MAILVLMETRAPTVETVVLPRIVLVLVRKTKTVLLLMVDNTVVITQKLERPVETEVPRLVVRGTIVAALEMMMKWW